MPFISMKTTNLYTAQSAGVVEYADCISAKGVRHTPPSQ